MNKKSYVKPDAMLVDFSLSSSIAAGCRYIATQADAQSCMTANDNGWTVYGEYPLCDSIVNSNICYHVPTEDTNIFAS